MLVYHLMPKHLAGDALHPLNTLKTLHPEIYAKHIQKYRGREQVVERQIPILNCLWNDVLFLTNVHPEALREGFIAAGQLWRPQQWAAVETVAAGFNGQNAVVYYPDPRQAKGDFALPLERFTPFEEGYLQGADELPSSTVSYYLEAAARGEPIFAWRDLPHILFRGSVALTNVDVLTI